MTKKRTTVGVYINNLEAEYQRSIWSGIDAAARERDVDVIFLGRGDVSSPQLFDMMRNRICEFVTADRYDGLIVVSSTISGYAGGEAIFRELTDLVGKIPIVNLGPAYPGVASVTVDNRSGIRDVVRHLVEAHGRTRFVFVSGPDHNIDSNERKTAFLETLAEFGLEPVEGGLLGGMFRYNVAKASFGAWLERGIPFDAVVTANDNMACAIYDALSGGRYSVPDDISITGFDDSAVARFFAVPLTTVRQPIRELGYEALKRVVGMIADNLPPESVSLPTLPVYRQSCGCLSREVQDAASPDGLESSCADALEKLLPGITGTLASLFSRISAEPLSCADFLSAFRRALYSPSSSPSLFNLLGNYVSTLERSLWRGSSGPVSPGTAQRDLLACRELALHQARILLKEHAETWQANQLRTFVEQSSRQHHAVVGLISSFSLESLLKTLMVSLRDMSIDSCFMSLFVPGTDNRRSRLVLGMYRGQPLDFPGEGLEFDSIDLFPRDLVPAGNRINVLAEVLYHQDRALGLLVIEDNPLERQLFNVLSNQIMGAVRSSLLMDELREKDLRLNEAFAELRQRADELESANAQIRQNQAQLILSEKMATLGRLTAGMAHEMNTPLGAAMASLSEVGKLLDEYRASAGDPDVTREDHLEIASEMGKMIDLATRSVERAAGFIRTIKGQTRMGGPAGETVQFDLRKSVRDTVCLLGHNIRKGNVAVVLDEDEPPVTCSGYPDKLSQVLTNLMVNAVDAMAPEGGTMTVRVGERPLGAGGETACVIELSDTGCGIERDNLARIFEPLYTTKPVGVGTGLGLTIVHDIVVGDFKGDISVSSEVGAGTTFTITIPSRRS